MITAARTSVTGSGSKATPHFVATPEVGRKAIVLVAEAPEVDDARDACGLGRCREVVCSDTVCVLETAGSAHRMDQVVGDVAPLERRRQGLRKEYVGANYVDLVAPRAAVELARVPGEAHHVVSVGDEPRNEPASYVSGCSGDGDSHGVLLLVHRTSVPRWIVDRPVGGLWIGHPTREIATKSHPPGARAPYSGQANPIGGEEQ